MGQQAYGLSQSLHISMAEARDMIDRYYEAYPGVRTFLDNVVARAKQTATPRPCTAAVVIFRSSRPKPATPRLWRAHGHEPSHAGNRRRHHQDRDGRVSRRLEEEGFAAHMILQVHDELDFECPIDEVERLTTMVRDVMEHVVDLRVPLIAEASTGITWADAK